MAENSEVEASKKRKRSGRGRAKRTVGPPLYAGEVKDIWRSVTGTTGLVDRKTVPKITGDAVRIVDNILRLTGDKCVQNIQRRCDPDRETLRVDDVAADVRLAFLGTEHEHEIVAEVKECMDRVRADK